MAKTRDLQVYVTDPDSNDTSFTMKYANPDASDANLNTAINAIIGLTNNTYIDTTVKDSYSLNEAIS